MRLERVSVTYSAARSDPVSQGQSGQPYSHRQHHQQFDSSGLLSEAGEILVPDAQQLLLAVRMSHKLKGAQTSQRVGESIFKPKFL